MATAETNATTTSDGALTAGLFEESATAVPNFKKLKKAELIAFYEAHPEECDLSHLEDFKAQKVTGMRETLGQLFPANDLTSPEVTGLNPSDLIHKTVIEVQGLGTEQQAIDAVLELQDAAQFNFFKVGGILAEMQSKGWMGEHDDFWAFVEGTFGYKIRKAQVMIQVYNSLVACGATWDEVKNIGWGKLMVFAAQLTPENYKDWLTKAEGATMASLQELVKEYKQEHAGEGGADLSDLESTPIKRLTFSIHMDQEPTIKEALAKAKEQSGSDFDGNALEQIAAEFLAQVPQLPVNPDGPPNLRPLLKKFGSDEDGAASVLEQFCEVFPEAHVELYPDGKPELRVLLQGLVEEYGGEVFIELKEFESE